LQLAAHGLENRSIIIFMIPILFTDCWRRASLHKAIDSQVSAVIVFTIQTWSKMRYQFWTVKGISGHGVFCGLHETLEDMM